MQLTYIHTNGGLLFGLSLNQDVLFCEQGFSHYATCVSTERVHNWPHKSFYPVQLTWQYQLTQTTPLFSRIFLCPYSIRRNLGWDLSFSLTLIQQLLHALSHLRFILLPAIQCCWDIMARYLLASSFKHHLRGEGPRVPSRRKVLLKLQPRCLCEIELRPREFNYHFNFRSLPDRSVLEADGHCGGFVL